MVRNQSEGPGPTRFPAALDAVEHAALWVERPIRKVAGSNRLNPLPHAGTISVFLLGVVVVSGLYVTLFFQFGYQGSYESVAAMEAHVIQRFVRALHRYSSAGLVLTTIIHGWRIFAAARFTARPRRWRWASGVSALLMVWLAGVTGYWLVWDVRAQAISDATAALLDRNLWGARFAMSHLSGLGTGSGSGFMLALWFAHVAVSAAIVWFSFRHLRGSKLPWLPPRHWMVLMGGALVLVSLALPVGMLDPADPARMVSDMPLDPFVLFLLPPLLTPFRWVAVLAGLALLSLVGVLPWFLKRGNPAPILIDEEACTGCELCVIDCPYDALVMAERPQGPELAVVDPQACVACGICLGSCAFGAIELPGIPSQRPEVKDRHVIVACDRHVSHSALDSGPQLVSVRCAGMFSPPTVRDLMEQGAKSVQLVGCPPNDCRYGVGNTLAAQRLEGKRAPHPPRRWMASLTQDWVAPSELASAVSAPGTHPSADGFSAPSGRERYVGAGVLVLLSVVGVAFATRAPFRGSGPDSEIRVAVDHTSGQSVQGVSSGPVGAIDVVEVTVDGVALDPQRVHRGGDESVGLVDWEIRSGIARVEVAVISGDARVPVFSADAVSEPGRRILIPLFDVAPPPGAKEGKEVFNARAVGCATCHAVDSGADPGVGPNLAAVGARASDRVEGLTAEQYLRQSIFLPDQYVVEGWPSGQMLPFYRDQLTEEQLSSLIAYLLTLTEEES